MTLLKSMNMVKYDYRRGTSNFQLVKIYAIETNWIYWTFNVHDKIMHEESKWVSCDLMMVKQWSKWEMSESGALRTCRCLTAAALISVCSYSLSAVCLICSRNLRQNVSSIETMNHKTVSFNDKRWPVTAGSDSRVWFRNTVITYSFRAVAPCLQSECSSPSISQSTKILQEDRNSFPL